VSSRVKGGAKLRRTLKRFPDEATEEVKQVLETGIRIIQRDAARRVPVDTGNLKRALLSGQAVGKLDKGLKWEFGVRGKKLKKSIFYARFIEFGTKGFTGRDRRGRMLNIPPMPPRPFMQPAVNKYRRSLARRIDKAVDRAIDKVARGQ